jgi:hypothetical protein
VVDSNRDGLLDLVCKFSPLAAELKCGVNSVLLRATRRGTRRGGEGLVYATAELTVGPCAR